jgi:hypothetical protein
VLGGKEILGDDGLSRLTYDWQVSGAGIISGQGTSQVVIRPTSEGSKDDDCINVTLQVKGLPPTCESIKSCKLRINRNCRQPLQIEDEYHGVELQNEKAHLDKIAKSLDKSGPNSVLYLVAYAGRSACVSEAEWRVTRAKRYLVEAHHIEENRLITVNGGFRESFAIELFVLPNNACGPLPTPTLRAGEVQISGLCVNKYK